VSLIFAAIVIAGCGSSAPPSISRLQEDRHVVIVDTASSLSGTFDFEDPDGDVELLAVELTVPTGEMGELPRAPLAGVDGVSQGTSNWSVSVEPQVVGEFAYEIWVIDRAGNESNRLPGGFTAALACESYSSVECVCSSTSADELAECSEASVGGTCCQNDALGQCSCTGQACVDSDVLGMCMCGPEALATGLGGTRTDTCAPDVGEFCCINVATDLLNGTSCTCSDAPCTSSQIDVVSCDLSSIHRCGDQQRVDSCR
jgi:hypothetical protein